jgi:hypothetical protein
VTDQSFPTLASICSSSGAATALPGTQVVSESAPEQAPQALVQELSDPRRDLTRLASGLGFAALYGLALGARLGGASLLRHALASSAGLAAVGVLGMPALFVLLALVNAPVSPAAMLSAGARALGSAGFVLAGLAPSAALLSVSIESATAAAFVAQGGLLLSGGIGLYQLVSSVRRLLTGLPFGLRMKSTALLLAFCVFAVLLACRVWCALPILQVGR